MKSEDIPRELKDLLIKSLEGEDDPRLLEVKEIIGDIAYGNDIDLKESISDKEILTIWNEYSARKSDLDLGIEEIIAKDTKPVVFIAALLSIQGVSIIPMLDHVVKLAAMGYLAAIVIRWIDKKEDK